MNPNLQTRVPDKREPLTSIIASRNELLGDLLRIPDVSNYLFPELQIVPVTVNQVLYEQGDKIDVVYFPLDSAVSGLAIMEDGTTLETTLVGRDGLVGISSVLGSGLSRQWMWVTIAGQAIQLDARFLDKVFVQNEAALRALLKYYRSLVTQVSQRCVCNTRHTILERLCCWLLMVHDRVGENKLSLTQEMIASRVGARRAGITVAAGMLQEMGAITYRRGQLQIANREVLERAVCECYAFIHAEFKRSPPRLFSFFTVNEETIHS
jgi:CRP-like cAMP-binding protein